MTSIIVTEEQAQILKGAPISIEFRSPQGEYLGAFKRDAAMEEDIQLALQARDSGGPYYTTAEVLAHLKTLEDREKK